VYFSQINQFHCRTLVTALVGLKIKCYLTFTFVPNNFISFLEVIVFPRLKMNIFTVQMLENYMYKYHFLISKTHSPAEYVEWMLKISNLWFNVSYHPYKTNVLYPLWTRISEEISADWCCMFQIRGLLFTKINLSIILLLIHIISSKATTKRKR
jgi:hypothetical protein